MIWYHSVPSIHPWIDKCLEHPFMMIRKISSENISISINSLYFDLRSGFLSRRWIQSRISDKWDLRQQNIIIRFNDEFYIRKYLLDNHQNQRSIISHPSYHFWIYEYSRIRRENERKKGNFPILGYICSHPPPRIKPERRENSIVWIVLIAEKYWLVFLDVDVICPDIICFPIFLGSGFDPSTTRHKPKRRFKRSPSCNFWRCYIDIFGYRYRSKSTN